MRNVILGLLVLAAVIAGAVFLYSPEQEKADMPRAEPTRQPQIRDALGFSISAYRGKVLVLLLGMEACPETRRITSLLAPFAKAQPEDVVVARVDVPPPGQPLKPRDDWSHAYIYAKDPDRSLARQLDFFYYPTLYVVDRDGVVRYAGGFEANKVAAIVRALTAEPSGLTEKKMYSPPLPAVGTSAPAFAGKDLQGKPHQLSQSLGQKATLVVFGSSSCPFSVKALSDVQRIASSLGRDGLAVVVINKKEELAAVRKVYEENEPGVPVILDSDGSICVAYGVEPVPFQFVLDAKGIIAQRGPFSAASATSALATVMGGAGGHPATSVNGAG